MNRPSRAHVDSLEPRRLLAGDVGFVETPVPFVPVSANVTSRGSLVVKSTAVSDVISIRKTGGSYRIDDAVFGDPILVPAKQVKRILVESNEGDDRVGVAAGVTVPVTLAGGAGDDKLTGQLGNTLIGGGGNDVLFIAVPKFQVINAEDGPFTGTFTSQRPSLLSGGDGNDLLVSWAEDNFVGGRGIDTARYFNPNHLAATDPGGKLSLDDPRIIGVERLINPDGTVIRVVAE